MKIAHTFATRHQYHCQVGTDLEVPPFWLAFIFLEGAMQAAEGKAINVLSNCEPCQLQ